jgi:integrase/recombinase XerD
MEIALAKVATDFLERSNLSTSTIRSYESTLMPLLNKYGKFPIAILTRQDIQEYLERFDRLAPSTYNRHQSIVKALFNFAFDRGYLDYNPINRQFREYVYQRDDRAKSNLKNSAIRYLSPKQLNLVYDSIEKNSRLHILVLFLHHTGIKTSEALALNIDDLDLEWRKFIAVNSFQKQRWCFYGEELAAALDRYLRLYRHQEHLALLTAKHPTTKKVSRSSYRTVHQDWTNLIENNEELQGLRLQDLRHTFIMERIETIDLVKLKEILGYESIQGLLRYREAIK